MRHLDLFSGIGGFALAASWVWPNHQVVSFCEKEPFCQKVLARHWPDVPCHDDIHTLDGAQYANIDLLTGGFPCQPYSSAGQRRGKTDDRHLWPEMLRIIREARPRLVLAENVYGLVTWNGGVVLDEVLSDLENEGYEVQACVIPACAVDAPHRRDRLWIVAHRQGLGVEERRLPKEGGQLESNALGSRGGREDAGAVAHAPAFRCKEHPAEPGSPGEGEDSRRLPQPPRGSILVAHAPLPNNASPRWSDHRGGAAGTERNGRGAVGNDSGPAGEQTQWLAEPGVGRVVDGLSRKLDKARLKALGNAIVPQVAAWLMHAMKLDEHMWGRS